MNKHDRELLNRAGKWETRCQKWAAKGDFNKAGECRTKALKLQAEYLEALRKERGKK